MSIKPGARLGKRYQLLSPIATGGMGQVWRAEDTTLHRVVAAKILRSEFTGDETFLKRFRAEAQNTASLSHPNIASVYDYGEQVHEAERLAYLVMELVEGEPLVDILARERRITPERALDYLEQTATGLAAAHREGMVHRDVKPGNLIIRPDGVLKITDFGIARAANAAALTEQGTVVGTAQYLAPEQAEGKPARPASDIYALGVVGYECLAGFRPFDGDNSVAIALSQIRDTPRPLPPDVPAHIRRLVELTMTKNPDARYRDGDEYVRTVRAVRAGQTPTPPPYRPSQVPAAPVQLPGTPRPPGAPMPPGQRPGGPPAPARRTAGPGGPNGPGQPPAQGRPTGPTGPGGPGGPSGPGGPGGPSAPGGPSNNQNGPPHSPTQRGPAGPGSPSARSGAFPQSQLGASPAHPPPGAGSNASPTPGGIPRRWWWIAGIVAAVLVIALVIALVTTSGDDEPDGMPTSTPTTSSSAAETSGDSGATSQSTTEPASVTESDAEPNEVILDEDKIVGQPLDYVLEGLVNIDYDLQVEAVYDGDPQDGKPGTVTAGEPFGTPIEPKSMITLHVVPEPSGAPSS